MNDREARSIKRLIIRILPGLDGGRTEYRVKHPDISGALVFCVKSTATQDQVNEGLLSCALAFEERIMKESEAAEGK